VDDRQQAYGQDQKFEDIGDRTAIISVKEHEKTAASEAIDSAYAKNKFGRLHFRLRARTDCEFERLAL
jgi:hypothetical protein